MVGVSPPLAAGASSPLATGASPPLAAGASPPLAAGANLALAAGANLPLAAEESPPLVEEASPPLPAALAYPKLILSASLVRGLAAIGQPELVCHKDLAFKIASINLETTRMNAIGSMQNNEV